MSRETDDTMVTDLFGNVRYLVPRIKGRPPFEWTEENSRKISMLLAQGWSNERIANCVPDPRTGKAISISTLKRHFRPELRLRGVARDQLTARRLMLAYTAAEKGNVGAMRHLDQLIEKNDQALADAMLGDGGRSPNPAGAEPKPGKKELNAAEAVQAEADLQAELEAEAARASKH